MYRLVAGYHLESDVFIPWGSGQPVGPGIEVHLCALLSGMDSCPAWLLSLPPRPTTLPQDMLFRTSCPGQIPLWYTSPLSAGFFKALIMVDIYGIHRT